MKQQVKNRIKQLENFIKESGNSDPRDAYDIKYWKEEIQKLKNETKDNT